MSGSESFLEHTITGDIFSLWVSTREDVLGWLVCGAILDQGHRPLVLDQKIQNSPLFFSTPSHPRSGNTGFPPCEKRGGFKVSYPVRPSLSPTEDLNLEREGNYPTDQNKRKKMSGSESFLEHTITGDIYKWYISGIYCQLGDYVLPTTY